MKRLILLLLVSILSYCGVSQKEYNDLKKISEDQNKQIVKIESDNKKIITENKKIVTENKKIKTENNSLKKEIEDLKFGAERLVCISIPSKLVAWYQFVSSEAYTCPSSINARLSLSICRPERLAGLAASLKSPLL